MATYVQIKTTTAGTQIKADDKNVALGAKTNIHLFPTVPEIARAMYPAATLLLPDHARST